MEQLIPVVAKLQDVLGAVGGGVSADHSNSLSNSLLDLPQIVVVGGQSSGKSSVLEAIVGRSFLPRGCGIVTRRPLVLQLYNTTLPPFSNSSDYDDEVTSSNNENVGRRGNPTPKSSTSNQKSSASSAANKQQQSNNPNKKAAREILPGDEWGEFLHLPGRRFHDFADIREEIVRETDRLTGRNKGISPQALHLKIFSPRVLQLTLVDLPGIAKVALGDQPADIEEQIRNMCLEHISNPNAIILAVTPANTDLANSDALKLARIVDPMGDRTIGVLTKLDLMDPGTDASDILLNKVIPLQRGYIGVINRGQLDVERDAPISEGLKKEWDFFKSHPAYRSVQQKCGTHNLARNLNTILMHHIRECLPDLKNRIVNMITDVQHDLDALGTPTDDSTSNLGATMLALLSKFSASFANCIEGKGSSHEGLEMNELFGGARIGFIFSEVFVRSLMAVEPFDGLSDEEIRTTITNSNGTRASLFVPEVSFDILVRRQISRLEQPGLQCVDLVFDELQRISSQCEPVEFQRFPKLRDHMIEVVSNLLRRCVSPTQMMVSNLVKIELSYINTSHPDFIGGSRAVARLMERFNKDHSSTANGSATSQHQAPTYTTPRAPNVNGRRTQNASGSQQQSLAGVDEYYDTTLDDYSSTNGGGSGIMNYLFRGNTKKSSASPRNGSGLPAVVQLPRVPDTMRQTNLPTERERIETEIIKSLIESYFAIVRKNFIDLVPKTIMYFLVNHARDSLQNELVSELYRESMITELMQEADDIFQRRKTCQETRDLLKKALDIVNEVRDFNTFK